MSVRSPSLRIFWARCSGAPIRPGFQTYFVPSWRSFATSAPRCASAPKPARPAPRATPKLRLAGHNAGGIGHLALKVAQQGELVLFKAPSQRTYFLSAYSLSAFCFAYALYNSNEVFRDPNGPRPMWQQALFGGICVSMSVMGTLFFVRTNNMVRNITAFQTNGQTMVRFAIRRMIPFTKPYQVEVFPSQVTFSRRLVVSPDTIKRYESDSRKTGGPDAPRASLLKAPATAMSVAIWRMFQSVRQIFTSEDFILLQLEGQKATLRMDSNGFVSPDFLALGNPVQMSGPQQ